MFQNGRDAVPQQKTLHRVMDPCFVLLEVVTHYGKRVVRLNLIANEEVRDGGEEHCLNTVPTNNAFALSLVLLLASYYILKV